MKNTKPDFFNRSTFLTCLLAIFGSFLFLPAIALHSQSFQHPGLLSRQADLDRMAAKAAEGAQPWRGSWDILVSNTNGWLNHTPEAVETICAGGGGCPDGENYMRLARDCARAYQLALRYHGSGDARYAQRAIQILNAWASTHTGWNGDTNVSLRAGFYGYQLACAAELMRNYSGWQPEDFAAFQNYLIERFYPRNDSFLNLRHGTVDGHYWANWDLANMASMLAIGVVTDRRDIFDQALEYFYEGVGNGSIGNAVHHVHANGLGQWQESGRDQGHSLIGPQLMGVFCEIAWNQGIDLYSHLGNRLLASVEYVSKYNLGNDVPYVTYVWRHGHPHNRQETIQAGISDHGRGQIRPGWDLLYNHYVNRLGMAAPYTKEYAERARPEGGGFNHGSASGGFDGLGFTTLTHTLDPIPEGAVPGALRPHVKGRQITLSWAGSAYATSYRVKRSTTSGGPYTTLATVDAKILHYVDPGLEAGTTYYYVVSANNPDGESPDSAEAAATATGELHGTVIGTEGSWNNAGATKETVFDGSLRNYFDAPTSVAWAGLDLGEGVTAMITEIKYSPRERFAGRMVGGRFQGSNTADFSSGVVDLFTISSAPPEGELTSQSINANTPVRYVRYLGPSNGNGNVAEVQFHGAVSGLNAAVAPGDLEATENEEFSRIDLNWNPVEGADSYNVKRATASGGPYIILANVTGTSFTDTQLSAGVFYYVVTAVNSAGESPGSAEIRVYSLTNVALESTALASRDNASWNPAEAAASAFDGNVNTKWYTGGTSGSSGWIQADLAAGNEAVVVRYALTSANDAPDRDPKNWELLGSSDGANWITLDTRNGESFDSRLETKEYPIANDTGYRYYRLNILSNFSGSPSHGIQLAELTLLGYPAPAPKTPIEPIQPRVDLRPAPNGGREIRIAIHSQPNLTYQLQRSPDLTPGSWINLDSPRTETGEEIEFLDTLDQSVDRAFYRIDVRQTTL